MTEDKSRPSSRAGDLVLVVRRTIRATPERLFEAWTRPEQLLAWWGPRPVRCAGASIDLRVGGRYRIENELPGGDRLFIDGEFALVDPPRELVYTWSVRPGGAEAEIVTVRFDAKGPSLTEVVVSHERIANAALRDSHEGGWNGCLEGLALHVDRSPFACPLP
jgi:uncharacterized protein YndB with AHSA1/START domain